LEKYSREGIGSSRIVRSIDEEESHKEATETSASEISETEISETESESEQDNLEVLLTRMLSLLKESQRPKKSTKKSKKKNKKSAKKDKKKSAKKDKKKPKKILKKRDTLMEDALSRPPKQIMEKYESAWANSETVLEDYYSNEAGKSIYHKKNDVGAPIR